MYLNIFNLFLQDIRRVGLISEIIFILYYNKNNINTFDGNYNTFFKLQAY